MIIDKAENVQGWKGGQSQDNNGPWRIWHIQLLTSLSIKAWEKKMHDVRLGEAFLSSWYHSPAGPR